MITTPFSYECLVKVLVERVSQTVHLWRRVASVFVCVECERRGGLGKNNSGRFSGRFGGRAVNKQERMEASTLKKRRR